eukprot:Pompholyxophrys_sp_v1_NODE_75_length_2370_cov_2.187041.p1 type:complete len:116 gc:universal NODE_75_length_2370_cov_2.187041:1809-1462(-)
MGLDVDSLVHDINALADQLTCLGDQISEEEKLAALMNGLPESFDHVITTLQIQPEINYTESVKAILDYAERISLPGKDSGKLPEESLLYTHGAYPNMRKWQSQLNSSYCHRSGHK